MFDATKYLKKLKISGSVDVSFESLKLIQKQHLENIPFENIFMHSNKLTSLDKSKLFEKVITNGRGGFCYELNYLLYFLLKELGFNVKILNASTPDGEDPYDHLFLMVDLNEKQYFVDVAFGTNYFSPLEFVLNIKQNDEKGIFEIVEQSNNNNRSYIINRYSLSDGNHYVQYNFNLKKVDITEFNDRKLFYEKNENSVFKRNLLCRLEKEGGRIQLKQHSLKIIDGDSISETKINSFNQFNDNLVKYFKIHLTNDEISCIKSRFWN